MLAGRSCVPTWCHLTAGNASVLLPPVCPTNPPGHPLHCCSYTSKVTLQCPTAVHSRVDNSTLFSHLTNKWEFRCVAAGFFHEFPVAILSQRINPELQHGTGAQRLAGMVGLLPASVRAAFPTLHAHSLGVVRLGLPLVNQSTTHAHGCRRLGPTPHTTWLTFEVDFAFKSPLYRQVASIFFEEVRTWQPVHMGVPHICALLIYACSLAVWLSPLLCAAMRWIRPQCCCYGVPVLSHVIRRRCLPTRRRRSVATRQLVLPQVVQRMMGAFEGRCAKMYGPSSLHRRPGSAQPMSVGGR